MTGMRSYNEYCALARALDVVGQRWGLLIVRELMIREACRYTDLQNGLPGIASNLLAMRLRELEESGVISREIAPAPVATTLFRLTDRGRSLREVVESLIQWGTELVARPIGEEHFRGHWLVLPLQLSLRDNAPKEPPVSLEVRAGGETVAAETAGGSVRVRLGPPEHADAVVSGAPSLILGLLTGRLELREAEDRGLVFEGQESVIDRVRPTGAKVRAT